MKARKLITALVVGLSVFAFRVEAKTVLYTEYLTTNDYATAFYKSEPGRGSSPGIAFTRTANLATSGYLYNYAFSTDYHGKNLTRYALDRALQVANAYSLPTTYTRYSDARTRRYYSSSQVNSTAFDACSLDVTSSAKLEAVVLNNNLDATEDKAIALPMYQGCHLDYEFNLSYALAGGTGTGFNAVAFVNAMTLPTAVPTRRGYRFNGWRGSDSKSYAPGDRLELGATDNDLTLTAQWLVNEYTVSFVKNATDASGSMTPQEFSYGEAAGLRTCGFARSGYVFSGWATTSTGPVVYADGEKVSNLTDQHDAEVKLYAIWEPGPVTVEFNADNGKSNPASMTVIYKGVYGTLPEVTRDSVVNDGYTTDYTFAGWYHDDRLITADSQVLVSARHTLIAHWSGVTTGNFYTVTFDPAGGEVSPTAKSYRRGANYVDLPVPTKTYYSFRCWRDQHYTEVRNGDEVKLTGDETFTAQWLANEYTVNFVKNETGVSGTMTPQEFSCGETNRLKSCSFELQGYVFSGWAMTPTGPVVFKDGEKVTNLTDQDGGEVTLYAIWERGSVTVEFNAANGKSNPPSMTVLYEGTYGNLPEVTRDSFVSDGYTTDYTFAGWYYGDRLITADSQVLVSARHTLIAHWSGVTTGNFYTVSFDPAGGVVDPAEKQYQRGARYVDLPVPERAYYDFLRWSAGGLSVRDGDEVRLTSNAVFTAQWRQRTFQLTLDPMGGSVSPTKISCNEGDGFPELPVPERGGFVFAGWWTNATYAGEQVSARMTAVSNAVNTVYARWKSAAPAGQCAVTFDFGGALGTVVSNCVIGTALGGFPEAPANPGRSVKWWYSGADARPVTADTVVTGDLTVYARWTVDALNALTGLDDVAFDLEGAVDWCEETDATLRYGDRVTLRSGGPFVNSGDASTLRMYVPGPGTLAFHWAVDGIDAGLAQNYFYFYRDGETQPIASHYGTLRYWDSQAESVRIAGSFAWTYLWADNDPLTSDRAWLSALAWTPDASASSIDPWATDPVRTNLVITTGGNAGWTMATNDDATASGVTTVADLGDNSVSWLKAVTPAGPGELTFRWRVDCERGYTAADGSYVKTDYLEFSDGLGHVEFIDGTIDGYLTVTVTNLSSAPMTCVWRYVKDGDVSIGADRAWLDGLTWTGFAGSPEPTESDRPQITAVAAEDGVFRVTFAADGRFKYELERSESLAPAAWTVFEPRQFLSPDADGVVSFEPTVEPGRPRMFYRVKVLKKD